MPLSCFRIFIRSPIEIPTVSVDGALVPDILTGKKNADNIISIAEVGNEALRHKIPIPWEI